MTVWFGNDAEALLHCWHPVAAESEVADTPLAVEIAGEQWVVARLGDEVAAFPDVCPHRRVPLSTGSISGPHLVCGYHGWSFEASGRCALVPALGRRAAAPRGLGVRRAAGVHTTGGMVWVSPRSPVLPEPAVPVLPDRMLTWAACPVRETTTSVGAAVDNFLDVAHFGYLHRGTFGVSASVAVTDYDVSVDGPILTARHEAAVDHAGSSTRRIARYTLRGPTILELELHFPDLDQRSYVVFWLHAVAPGRTVIHKLVGVDARHPSALAEHVGFETRVLQEDLAMLERIVDSRLPLDLRAEQHTRADRAGVALRRLLAGLHGAVTADTDNGSVSPADRGPATLQA